MGTQTPVHVLRGFFMGAADIVPGVSGGTVALVFGIYHRLVTNIRTASTALGRLARLDARGAWRRLTEVEWGFLLPLVAGIALAILSLARLISYLLDNHPVEIAAVFLGLVLGSIAIAWRLLRRRDPRRILILLVVGIAVFVALGVRTGTSEDTVTQVESPEWWAFFLAGALAICAMILPGVSGSFLLVMVGMYGAVLDAVNGRDAAALSIFVLGCVVGLALFSQVLHWALDTHYDSVMAALIGLMLGSLRVLWPWPDGTNTTELGAPSGSVVVPVALAVVGFAAVFVIAEVAIRLEHRTERDVVDEITAT